MSALDQAFIRAYEKQTGPKLAEQPGPATDARRIVNVVPGPPSARLRRVSPAAPTHLESLEQNYADGSWYRIDRPAQPMSPESAAPLESSPEPSPEPMPDEPTRPQVPRVIKPAMVDVPATEPTPAAKPAAVEQPMAVAPPATRPAPPPASVPIAPRASGAAAEFSGVLTAEDIARLMSLDMTPVVCAPDYPLDLFAHTPPQVDMRQAETVLTPASVSLPNAGGSPASGAVASGAVASGAVARGTTASDNRPAKPEDPSPTVQLPSHSDQPASARPASLEEKPTSSQSAAGTLGSEIKAPSPTATRSTTTSSDTGADARSSAAGESTASRSLPVDVAQPVMAADDRDIVRVQETEAAQPREVESRRSSSAKREAATTNSVVAPAKFEAAPATSKASSAKPTSRPPFHPEWEVDRFAWPEICEALYRNQRQYFSDAGQRLKAAATDGLNVLAITSPRRGDGKTTLALCLARCAVKAGLRVALIDADFAHPQLQTLLGMSETCSWHETFQNGQPLADGAIVSREDELIVFPLTRAGRSVDVPACRESIAAAVQRIASHFELVIVDMGSMDAAACELCDAASAQPTNAVIVVRDLRKPDNGEIDDAVARIQSAGITAVGIAENYGSAS